MNQGLYVHIRRVFLCIIEGSFTSPILNLKSQTLPENVALEWVNLIYIHIYICTTLVGCSSWQNDRVRKQKEEGACAVQLESVYTSLIGTYAMLGVFLSLLT